MARKNLVPLIGNVAVAKLQPHQISAGYSSALASGRRDGKGGLSARTVHHMHRILNQALSWGVRQKIITTNPASLLERRDRPKVERKRMQVYDLGQTVMALDSLRETRMFVPMMIAVLCGLRRGEVAALRWRCIDLKNGGPVG